MTANQHFLTDVEVQMRNNTAIAAMAAATVCVMTA
jgi:hypothetical protein